MTRRNESSPAVAASRRASDSLSSVAPFISQLWKTEQRSGPVGNVRRFENSPDALHCRAKVRHKKHLYYSYHVSIPIYHSGCCTFTATYLVFVFSISPCLWPDSWMSHSVIRVWCRVIFVCTAITAHFMNYCICFSCHFLVCAKKITRTEESNIIRVYIECFNGHRNTANAFFFLVDG